MHAANQAQETAASVTDSLTDLQNTLVALSMADPAEARLNIDELTTQLSLLAQLAERNGARALPNITLRLVERLLPLQHHSAPALEVAGALEEWVQLSFAYLAEPTNPEHWQPLIEFLNLPLWNESLSQGQTAILNRLFEIDVRPLRPAPPPPSVSDAPLDDHKVAALLDVTDMLPAATEPVSVDDLEETVLVAVPSELLLQIADEPQQSAEPVESGAAPQDFSDEISSSEPTVQVAVLVLPNAMAMPDEQPAAACEPDPQWIEEPAALAEYPALASIELQELATGLAAPVGWDHDVLADYSGENPLPSAAEIKHTEWLEHYAPAGSEVAVWDEEPAPTQDAQYQVENQVEYQVEPEYAAVALTPAMTTPDTGERDASAYPELPAAIAELVAMIHEELTGCMQSLSTALESAATSALTGEPVSLEDYRWQVERLSSAAESIGLHGLHEFLARVLEASCLIESAAISEAPQQCEVLDRWPPLVDEYFQPLANASASQALVDYLCAQDFAMPLDAASAVGLFARLCTPEFEASAGTAAAPRALQATAADVALTVPDDIHPEVLDSLLHELPGQTQEFSSALQRIAAGTGAAEDIRVAQRIAHTLKGSANTVGIRGIAQLSHHLEDIFLALQEHDVLPPAALARTLVDAADCLEAMSEALLGIGPAPSQSLKVLQEVLDWANRIDTHGVAGAAAPAPTAASFVVAVPPEADSPARPFIAAQSESQAVTPTLRVASTQVDDLLRLSGESRIVGGQLTEGVRRLEQQLHAVRRQNHLFQQLVSELEQLVDIRGVTMPLALRRESNGFDALELDQYSELHTVSRRLTEAATDAREWSASAQTELRTLEDLLLSQARHSGDSQESILKMRMVPASTIVGRLQRGVRQTCRLLDKEVELSVKGAETLVDSDTLNQLIDPLMHLMRNAIDHGIETAERRLTTGKQSEGHLIMEFGREGNQIFVRCTDDGRGLDYPAIRAIAMTRGLINAEAALSDAQLARLILEPGFSTRTEVTQVSGRGIGLDIVHSRVLELKGTFDVQSETGRGCRFMIRLPATLLSAHALLVRHGKHTVAVASRGIRQILDPHAYTVAMLGTRMTVQVGQEIYEAHPLQMLLGQSQYADQPHSAQPVLLVEVSTDRLCAVLVQGVLDTIDVVIKPLGAFVPRSVGLVGATILGNGSVAPVVDLPDLLRAGARAIASNSGGAKNTRALLPGHTPHQQHQPTVLVVDDSLSVRRSMEQLLRDSGYQVRLARDGLEAVAMIEANQPDLMLVDLEMPRMNGMELTAHVRNRAATRALPVIMITSRSTDKHRKQAELAGVNYYMTKPFAEEVLLAQMTSLLKRSA